MSTAKFGQHILDFFLKFVVIAPIIAVQHLEEILGNVEEYCRQVANTTIRIARKGQELFESHAVSRCFHY